MNKPAKKTLILATLMAPSLLFSDGILNRISGSTGLEYVLNKNTSKTSKSKQNITRKFIELGYYDFIYSPNLLQYAIQTKFTQQNTVTDKDGSTTTTSNTPTSFDVNVILLQNSIIPARITASKSSKPITTVNETDGILSTSYESENYELNGDVKLNNKLNINYNIRYALSDSVSNDEQQNITDNNYALNINKQFKNHAIYTNLAHHTNEIVKTTGVDTVDDNELKLGMNNFFDAFSIKTDFTYEQATTMSGSTTLNTDETVKNGLSTALTTEKTYSKIEYKTDESLNTVDNDANELSKELLTIFRWKITDKVSVQNTFNTYEEDFSSSESFTENINLSWFPSPKYNLTTYLSTTEFKDASDKITSQYGSLNSTYNISKNFFTGQSLSYSNLESSLQDTESIDLSLNSSYTQPIFDKSLMNLSGKVSAINSTSTEPNDTGKTYSYDLTLGIINKFDHKQSSLSYDINYYEAISTLNDEEQKVRFEGAFETLFINDISYIANADYSIRKISPLDSTSEKSTQKVLNFFNGMQFSERLDLRGRLVGRMGLKYSKRVESNADTFTSLNPDGTLDFSYRLWRTIMLRSNLNINRDSGTEITTYRSESSLLYKFRKLTIELGMNLNKQKGISEASSSNYTFMFKRTL